MALLTSTLGVSGGETFSEGVDLWTREDYEGGLRGPPSPSRFGLPENICHKRRAPAQLCSFCQPQETTGRVGQMWHFLTFPGEWASQRGEGIL